MWKLRMQCPSTYCFLEISAIQPSEFRIHVQDCTTRVNVRWTQRMLMSRYKVDMLFLFKKLLTVLLIPVPALWMFQKILHLARLFRANWWGEHQCDCGSIVFSSRWAETCIQCRHQHSWEVQVHLLLPVLWLLPFLSGFLLAASKDLSCRGSFRTALVFGVSLSQKCHSSTPCKFTHSVLQSQIERDAEMWSKTCTYSTKYPHLCGAIEQKSDKPSEQMPPRRTLWLVHPLF
jgi:hypothetical protein